MRAPPAFQVSIRRFGVWRAGVAALIAITWAVTAAWLASGNEDAPLALRVGVSLIDVAVLVAGATLMRRAPLSLRWDGQAWHLGPAASAGDERWRGQLAVAIDWGGWLLLKFEHADASAQRRTTWLPVQRRGLGSHWHALRCAVYCARPAPGSDTDSTVAHSQNSKNERP
jgi:hypothetical protein